MKTCNKCKYWYTTNELQEIYDDETGICKVDNQFSDASFKCENCPFYET